MNVLLAAVLALASSAHAYSTIRFLDPIVGEELAKPVAAAATDDRLYVVDEQKNTLILYDEAGKFIKSVGSSGKNPGEFSSPRGVAIGPGGKVYVADTGNHRVQIFDKDGKFIKAFGEKGSKPGKLKNPESVAIGSDGIVVVADTGNDRVQIFTREGVPRSYFGTYGKETGKFRAPARVSVDRSGNIYVLDRGNERIQKFDASAKFLVDRTQYGNDMAVDGNSDGSYYWLDGTNGKVLEMARDGFIMGKFGSLGSGVGQMRNAQGIAVGPGGLVIVLDTGNSRIHRVELQHNPPPAAVAAQAPAAPAPAPSEPVAAAPAPPPAPAPAPRVETGLGELPAARRPNPKAHAVVIGIERYRGGLPRADYAAADAKLAAEYFKRVLGVPEENLAILTDDTASKGDFEKYFERWLPNRVEKDDEVYVYFSGHGAPDPAKGDSYLVPYDGDPTYIKETGYSMQRLYAKLSELPARRVVVAMDSCFSGAGGRSVLAKGARPLVTVQQAAPPAGLIVLSASAGDQISNTYQEQGHGLFTFFLLKGMKEKGADFRAVYDYLRPEVARVARRQYNSDQTPQWRKGK